MGAAALGYLAAFLVSYFGHMYFSFAVPPDHRTHLWRFIVLTTAMFALSLALTWTVTGPLRQTNGVSVVVVMLVIPLHQLYIQPLLGLPAGAGKCADA